MNRETTSTCRTLGVIVGLLLLIGVAANLPDVAKYIKLKTM